VSIILLYTSKLCGFKISNMSLKVIFTWWNKQTLGTFFKTLFTGILVGKDNYGNKYYKNKSDDRWVIYSKEIEATKITADWYHWIHHTSDKIPSKNDKKHFWQKEHSENKTGTSKSYRPVRIRKENIHKKYETWK